MKKSLIALAALAVVSAASAQSSVTISGGIDFSAIGTGKITTQAANAGAIVSTKTSSTGAQNAMSTGQVSIAGTEDLGGGLKASFVLNSGITGTDSFAGRDRSLALSGGFGTVRIGAFVPAAAYGFSALSGHVATSIGSIYQVGSSGKQTGNTISGGSFERQNNNVQYTSPAFNGLTLNLSYANNSSDSSASTLPGELKSTQTGFSVLYANGPLSAGVGINNRKNNVEAVAGTFLADGTTALVAATVASNNEADLNWIGASYDLGAAKLFASHVMREDDTTTAAGVNSVTSDIKLTSFGVSVPMGAFTFAASAYTGKNDVTILATDDTKMSGNQLSVRYALSKRTYLYALNGTNKVKLDTGNTGGTATKYTATSLGLVHSF